MIESAPGAKTREMLMVHDAFRREFGPLAELARGVADGDRERVELIAGHVELISFMLHHHHQGEDASIWPRLLERCPEEIPSVHLMEEQHERLAAAITELEAALVAWRGTGEAAVGTALAEILDRMVPAVLEHLDAEERQVLPLVEKYITAAEWYEMTARNVETMPQDKALVILGMLTHEGSPQTVQEAAGTLPPDERDSIMEAAPKAYAAYTEQVYGTPNVPHGDILNG
ncbi:hemerythrin domain-containing protein [Nonomuraea sp. KM90]|uniref:hemerythrin domain-containing protein n=1 Tax=Nonomuraea sp. KM90 TaxID=3457428 RepID=UPI003FCDBCC5